MRSCRLVFHAICLILLGAACLPAAERLALDFEKTAHPPKFEQLDLGKDEIEIVSPGADGRGHCLRLANRTPAISCSMAIKGPIRMEKNLTLSLDHREEVESGFEGAYLAVALFVDGQQWFWNSDEFSGTWRHLDLPLAKIRSSDGRQMQLDTVFSKIQIYARVKEKTKVRDATKARLTLWLDNLRLHTDPPPSRLADVVQESYSNPPLFIWRPAAGAGIQKLQYSQDRNFPAQATQTVDVPWNFFTPPAPIEPGTWYWRVRVDSPLSDHWSDIQPVVVGPEAHRFTTPPIPAAQIARRPRPWLRPLAQIGQSEVTEARRKELVKSAKKIFDRGIPEHPGPHVPGDPRWPTWIDWYGKVAGNITGGTGRRLQAIAQYAMLSGDPQVIDWTKQLALETCKWDPEGGSAMRLGDIGAQHLLRGLDWCYDVCHDAMTPSERETLRKIIVQRARQFSHQLNPFRGSEANNHAWLQALALGESGLVLLGEHDEAESWADYTRQLYVGRFLCCLGYQGDNNEGISYWGYGLGFVIEYGDLLRTVAGIDLFQHPWLNQTARFPMYTAPPEAWAVSFADTGMPNHGVRGPAQTGQVRDLAVRTRDPYALWYSGAREPVEGLAPREPADLPQSIHYRAIGVVVFNTSLVDGRQGATVAMHSGRYWAGHQHPDQNHFVIHAYGEKLAIDGGYYDWYGSPHFKAYSMQTLAHNTLLVDGEGQADRCKGADGRITAYHDSPGYGYTVGDAAKPEIYHGKLRQFDRRVLFIKPGFVVIHDLVASAKDAARYDWLLHAIVPIETNASARSFRIACKDAALQGQFFAPLGMKLEVKTGFPAEPVNRYSTNPVPKDKYFPEWTLHAVPEKPAVEEEFFAAMQIQRLTGSAQPAAVFSLLDAPGVRGVKIRCGDRTHLVLFRGRNAQGPIQAEGLTTDGDVAAIELDAGQNIVRALAIHAKSLVYRGKKLFQSSQPADWSGPGTR